MLSFEEKKRVRELEEHRREQLKKDPRWTPISERKVMESFRWLTPQFKTSDAGKKSIKIKGVACRSDVISRNERKYVEEELVKSARTFIGRPITINHQPDKVVGHVEWMEFEDGALEYLATVNKEPYVSLLRDGSAEIRGVSIEAGYLFNQCPQCGAKFDSEDAFRLHMDREHFVKVGPKEVHGIVGQALSLVLAPEEPGVPDTSVELFETAPGFNKLVECVLEERDFWIKKEGRINVGQIKKIGEPFAGYDSFEDCVSKNQDKADPQAYCASIQRKTEESDLPPAHPAPDESGKCPEGFVFDPETGKCLKTESDKREYEKGEGIATDGSVDVSPMITEAVAQVLDRKLREYIDFAQKVLKDYDAAISKLEFEVARLKEQRSLRETEGLAQRVGHLEKTVVELDNLRDKLKGHFKGHGPEVSKSEDKRFVRDPMREGKK